MLNNSQAKKSPFITVFTPTYNRAYSLGDVYNCLCEQTLTDFEWVIVDDGSIDNTEQLVQSWIAENVISILYVKKPNGGKHTAINQGVTLARGEWFLIFDSDDKCTPNTIERFYQIYTSLNDEEREKVSTISVRSMTESGVNVGPEYSFERKLVFSPLEQLTLRSEAERWGMNKTSLMREMPFPIFEGERFIPESLIWNRLSLKYAALFVNEALRVFTPREDGLTASMLLIRVKSAKGVTLCYEQMLDMPLNKTAYFKALVNYYRFSFHSKKHNNLRGFKEVVSFTVGYLFYLRDVFLLGNVSLKSGN